VAVRLLVLRERERMVFRSGAWWDIKGVADRQGFTFPTQLLSVGGKRVAGGGDFDEATGQLVPGRDVLLLDEPAARGLAARLAGRDRLGSVGARTGAGRVQAPGAQPCLWRHRTPWWRRMH
jgi:DNA topoisomerase-1